MLLVTGITGLTGRFLYGEIQQSYKGKEIKYLVRETSDTSWMNKNENFTYGNIKDLESIINSFEGVSEVLHLAPRNQLNNILKACSCKGIKRIYYINSAGIYSKFKKSSHVDLQNEETLKNSDLVYTIIRPTMIYGNHQDGNIHLLVKIMNKTSVYPIIGKGEGLMQPIYAGDLAKVIVSVLNQEELTRYKEYNVAGKEPIAYQDLLKSIASAMQKKVFFIKLPYSLALVIGKIGNKIPNKIINYEKVLRLREDKNFNYGDAAKDLDFHPKTFEEGIANEIIELRKQGIIK